jgi:hypothetical protein
MTGLLNFNPSLPIHARIRAYLQLVHQAIQARPQNFAPEAALIHEPIHTGHLRII